MTRVRGLSKFSLLFSPNIVVYHENFVRGMPELAKKIQRCNKRKQSKVIQQAKAPASAAHPTAFSVGCQAFVHDKREEEKMAVSSLPVSHSQHFVPSPHTMHLANLKENSANAAAAAAGGGFGTKAAFGASADSGTTFEQFNWKGFGYNPAPWAEMNGHQQYFDEMAPFYSAATNPPMTGFDNVIPFPAELEPVLFSTNHTVAGQWRPENQEPVP